ncbi:hypothetical protein SanaruYs_37110 [Chryseotalea sanaruensis]|uniref:Uncharacterized protein n=1 Tax=Chryseotalea sanaruensis TaxID=2482724 RepID=A0A401UF19_9BACT|nr:hypothetical protein SanaruYs_37110 [Chryseotalea sanaruensis]
MKDNIKVRNYNAPCMRDGKDEPQAKCAAPKRSVALNSPTLMARVWYVCIRGMPKIFIILK